MARIKTKLQPTWSDVKAKLAHFDRVGRLGLVQDHREEDSEPGLPTSWLWWM
jgi:hypothetical protein